MHIALVHSRIDPAGVNIYGHICPLLSGNTVKEHTWNCIEVPGRLIHERGIDVRAEADLIIFISRHTSIQPVPTLTVHVTGNIGSADLGGDPRSLAAASPAWMHSVLRNLSRFAPEKYRVSYEVTHHGPTDISTPSLFVEIGSTEDEWTDPGAGEAVARSIVEAGAGDVIPFIGFGGNHYAARETSIALLTRAAFGHIAHSRDIPLLDQGLVRDMKDKTGALAAYIDRKSVPAREVRRIESLLEQVGLVQLSEREIRELSGIHWETYTAIRSLAGQVAPGSRCHLHGMEGAGRPVAVTVDEALLNETLRIDESAFLSALDSRSIVHLSTRDGRILPIFIVYEENRSERIHDLISSCVKIIIQSENTAVEDDRLILRRTRFDPTLARNQGVPQGPLFGRLAAGKGVVVNGRSITPDMVSVCSERVIHIPGLERYV